MKKLLVVWLVATVIFMALTSILIKPWVEKRESIYSLYLPQVSSTPTLTEKQEIVYRWFHRQNVEEVKTKDFEQFMALSLVFYDYDLDVHEGDVNAQGFEISYLGLANDGKVYHVTAAEGWIIPYYTSSYTLEGDQLHLRLKRSDGMVRYWLGFAAFAGVISGIVSAIPAISRSQLEKERTHRAIF